MGGTLDDLEVRMLAGIEADHYHRYTDYVAQLETVLAMERDRHKDLIRVLREKQAILAKRSVERKVLENLKQRKQTEYYDTVTRLLQKESE
jgi:flagellar FliJ protein